MANLKKEAVRIILFKQPIFLWGQDSVETIAQNVDRACTRSVPIRFGLGLGLGFGFGVEQKFRVSFRSRKTFEVKFLGWRVAEEGRNRKKWCMAFWSPSWFFPTPIFPIMNKYLTTKILIPRNHLKKEMIIWIEHRSWHYDPIAPYWKT